MRVIRRGVFETNSSSTHSITMCSKEEYEKWESGEVLLDESWWAEEKFITKEEAIQKLKENEYYNDLDFTDEDAVDEALREEYIYTFEQYWDNCDYETFSSTYTTKNGEEIIAFGYFGYNG